MGGRTSCLQFKLKRVVMKPHSSSCVILLAIILEFWDFLNNKCLDDVFIPVPIQFYSTYTC